jgi:xanthosine utilization system XapX-like protein
MTVATEKPHFLSLDDTLGTGVIIYHLKVMSCSPFVLSALYLVGMLKKLLLNTSTT